MEATNLPHQAPFIQKTFIQKGDVKMKIKEIREIAKTWGVDTRTHRSKLDIIRAIQVSEGYLPCFRTDDNCDNDCLWKDDCTNHKY